VKLRKQGEMRLAFGMGRAGHGDWVCSRAAGSRWVPDDLSNHWARLRLPVTLHCLRHTHVSPLIAAGLDVVTISRRIGHSKSMVTLNTYAHLFGNTDERAATVVDRRPGGHPGRVGQNLDLSGGDPVAIRVSHHIDPLAKCLK
jgi:Phage integrase family